MTKQEQMKKLIERIRSMEINAANEALATATEGNSLAETNEEIIKSYTPDFSNEFVKMTGVAYTQTWQVMPSYDLLIGTAYNAYLLVTHVEVNLAAVCSSLGISQNSQTEVYLKLSGDEASITSCGVYDKNNNHIGTVQKVGNYYYIPLSLFKTGNTYPDTVTFYLSVPEIDASDRLSYDVFTPNGPTLSIEKLPTKTKYLEGESFNTMGMVVMATHSNGNQPKEEVTGYTTSVSGFNSNDITSTQTQTITVNLALGNFTASANMQVTVYPAKNVYYIDGENDKQTMDIHAPNNLADNEKVPAVITIHGGMWSALTGDEAYFCDKSYYNYMTDFITNTCGCVHVNINYRLLEDGGGLDTAQGANLPYMQMLEDIQSVISYLNDPKNIYHIDTSKLALMGFSAGGHLALLYAYKATMCKNCENKEICSTPNASFSSNCDKYKVSSEIPIALVISEAGPTDLRDWPILSYFDNRGYDAIEALVNNRSEKELASPYCIVYSANDKSVFPYTILMYGNGYNMVDETGDSMIRFSQGHNLHNLLSPEGATPNSSLFIFNSDPNTIPCYTHKHFGNSGNSINGKINPKNTISTISNYYTYLADRLTSL